MSDNVLLLGMTHILRPKVQSENGVERGGGDLGVGHCAVRGNRPGMFQEEEDKTKNSV
jgi:hypothetical protein